MPAIGDLGYGTSKSGVEGLLEEIRSNLITKVSENASDTSKIKTACDENWSGTSKERFVANLDKDVALLQDSLNQMYAALVAEINATSAAIMDFDQNLINE